MKSFYGTPFNKINRNVRLAVAELDRSADIMKNNIPIALKEGRKKDAAFEKEQLKSFHEAIGRLVKT